MPSQSQTRMWRAVVQISQTQKVLLKKLLIVILSKARKPYADNVVSFNHWLVEHYRECVKGESKLNSTFEQQIGAGFYGMGSRTFMWSFSDHYNDLLLCIVCYCVSLATSLYKMYVTANIHYPLHRPIRDLVPFLFSCFLSLLIEKALPSIAFCSFVDFSALLFLSSPPPSSSSSHRWFSSAGSTIVKFKGTEAIEKSNERWPPHP